MLRFLKNKIAQIIALLSLWELSINYYWYKALSIFLPFTNNIGLLLLAKLESTQRRISIHSNIKEVSERN